MNTRLFSMIAALGIAGFAALPASAEAIKVRLAKQFGIGYLPLTLIEEQGLLQKHAAAAESDFGADKVWRFETNFAPAASAVADRLGEDAIQELTNYLDSLD